MTRTINLSNTQFRYELVFFVHIYSYMCYILWVLSPFKEGLMLILNKLFRKQVKSFHLLLDQDPFIFLCSLHNIKYIKFTSLQDISIKVMQLSHSLFPSQVILFRVEFICIFSSLSKTGPSLIKSVPNSVLL